MGTTNSSITSNKNSPMSADILQQQQQQQNQQTPKTKTTSKEVVFDKDFINALLDPKIREKFSSTKLADRNLPPSFFERTKSPVVLPGPPLLTSVQQFGSA